MKLEYDVKRTLGTLAETETSRKKVTVTKWGENEPKLDIRTWRINRDGKEVPGKGVTLNRDEAETLAFLLADYLG